MLFFVLSLCSSTSFASDYYHQVGKLTLPGKNVVPITITATLKELDTSILKTDDAVTAINKSYKDYSCSIGKINFFYYDMHEVKKELNFDLDKKLTSYPQVVIQDNDTFNLIICTDCDFDMSTYSLNAVYSTLMKHRCINKS